ncbi:MAG: hypothetical protein GC137_01020 [Alphaproteobacteria bacterium]|nr:hypothetical protein [Alphaproteobacteria bacterium]
MSAVQKSAKASFYIFSVVVFLFIAGVIYFYVNAGSIVKQVAENTGTQALGVPVTIGSVDVNFNERTVQVDNIKIANPKGFKKDHAIKIERISIVGESFSMPLLTFKDIVVTGTDVNLEVSPEITNLGQLRKNAQNLSAASSEPIETKSGEQVKVIVKTFKMVSARINPSVTLVNKDLEPVVAPDVLLTNIGRVENGVVAQEAIAQIMSSVFRELSVISNNSGFLEGLSLESLNEIGVTTIDAFKNNLQKSFEGEVSEFKKRILEFRGESEQKENE